MRDKREKILSTVTKISVTQYYIKDQVDKIEKHLDKLNGRVNKNEKSISWLFGSFFLFGSIISAVLYALK